MENHVLQSMGGKCSLPTALNPGREKRKSLKSPKTKKERTPSRVYKDIRTSVFGNR